MDVRSDGDLHREKRIATVIITYNAAIASDAVIWNTLYPAMLTGRVMLDPIDGGINVEIKSNLAEGVTFDAFVPVASVTPIDLAVELAALA